MDPAWPRCVEIAILGIERFEIETWELGVGSWELELIVD
jgi:hypothetical protein